METNRKLPRSSAADRKAAAPLRLPLLPHPIPVPPDLHEQTPDNLEAWFQEAGDALRAELQSRRWS